MVSETALYKIDKKSLEIMRRLTSKSRNDGLEHGATFCLDTNTKLTLENECTGEKCSIVYNRSCKDGRKGIGTFHTHPEQTKFGLSFSDLNALIIKNESFGCLGMARAKEDNITCFEKRDIRSLKEKTKEDVYIDKLVDYEKELKTKLIYSDKRLKELETESETILKKNALQSSILANDIQTMIELKTELQERMDKIYEYGDDYFNKFFKKYNPEDLVED